MALLKQIRYFLGPIDDRELRSPELRSNFNLDEFGDDELWVKAVVEVVRRRSRLTAGTSAEKRDTNRGRLLLYRPARTSRAVQRKPALTDFLT